MSWPWTSRPCTVLQTLRAMSTSRAAAPYGASSGLAMAKNAELAGLENPAFVVDVAGPRAPECEPTDGV